MYISPCLYVNVARSDLALPQNEARTPHNDHFSDGAEFRTSSPDCEENYQKVAEEADVQKIIETLRGLLAQGGGPLRQAGLAVVIARKQPVLEVYVVTGKSVKRDALWVSTRADNHEVFKSFRN